MRLKKLRMAGIVAGAALLVLSGAPAHAGGSFTTDAAGVDYDAACIVGLGSIVPNAGNNCNGITTYDGSTDATDIGRRTPNGLLWCPPFGWMPADLCLGSVFPTASGTAQMYGGMHVRATTVPAPGNTTAPNGVAYDLPSANFVGANYINLFQNTNVHNNLPTVACPRVGTGVVLDLHGHAGDGYHFYTSYNINWDGSRWVHTAQIGEYNPSPDGGFLFYELGVNDGVDDNGDGDIWDNSNPYMIRGVNWDASYASTPDGTAFSVWADGVFRTPDTTNCANGFFTHRWAQTGDPIRNAKGLTTANLVLTLPVSIPLSLLCGATGGLICESDITTVGGFVVMSDTTDGNSTPGLLLNNIPGIAVTRGLVDNHTGLLDLPDTLGDGPTCPTPTVGGTLPPNPLFTGGPCQIDDDAIARGTFLTEMWDTTHNFIF